MKKLLLKLILVIVPVLMMLAIVIFIPASKSLQQSLIYAIVEKNELLKRTPAPRIIFIGGSNLSFGLDSKTIHDSLGLNPVNTGIYTNIGLKYMMSSTEGFIKENDIVILSPEYQQFYGDLADGETELLLIILDIYPNSIKFLDDKQYYTLIKYIPNYIQLKIDGYINHQNIDSSTGIYERKSFNSFGDAYIHWNLPKEKVRPLGKIEGKINLSVFDCLSRFRDDLYKKKAKLYITFPCYLDISFQKSAVQIKEVEQKLKSLEFNLLSNPERYIFPDSLIFNTPYHLTKKGVDLRTSLLIADLKKVI